MQNIVEIMDFTTVQAFNQCVFTSNAIEANQINATYETSCNFVRSYRNFMYGQICNNTFMSQNYATFAAWLDAGNNLTTGTVIANNTNN